MILNSPTISGSLTVTGNIIASGSITLSGSVASASYASNAELLDGLDSTVFTLTSSFAAQTASFTAFTASILSYTSSQNILNGKYATTGSNTFTGVQTVNSNLVVTGSITAQTLVVQTITSSVDFVTGSTRFGSILGNTHVFSGSVTMNPGGLFVSGSGLIGIGTTTPEGVLTIKGTSAQPASSGTTSNSLLQLVGSLNNELNIGSNTSAGGYGSYIQASDNNLAVPYSLNLQPNGGNVGIGTSTPLDTFVVSGNGGAILERFSGATVYSGDLYFYSARGTSASPTTKANGDTAMGIRPRAYDGTSYLDVASIVSKIDGVVSTNVMPGNLIFSTNSGSTTLTERMRITSGGYLLLNTTSSFYGQSGRGNFEMNGSTDNMFVQKVGNILQNYIYSESSQTEIYSLSKLRLSGGNVLLNTVTDYGYRLVVASNDGLYIRGGSTSAHTPFIIQSSSGVDIFKIRGDALIFAPGIYNFTNSNAANVWVNSDGSLYRSTASSIRYKENINDWNGSGLDTILALKPKTFKYKKDYYNLADVDFLGLIAEEVAEVSPYLAEYENQDRTGQVENVRYATIVVPLIKAIQELKTQNDALQSRIETLESK